MFTILIIVTRMSIVNTVVLRRRTCFQVSSTMYHKQVPGAAREYLK